MTKLHDVCGRVDYIRNPDRQENLYCTRTNSTDGFWEMLSSHSQDEFIKSGMKGKGKCVEARELIIALPESLTKEDPKELLLLFSELFHLRYNAKFSAALHHNKSKTNYHIHLIFCDREIYEDGKDRIASRNMFFDENGKHVRTKKEILDENGKIRSGCYVIKKGDVIETSWFGPHREKFKSSDFLDEVKSMYTDFINTFIEDEKDKLKVFDRDGPYLATKKIGKNNPKEELLKADNALREEWNDAVDHALLSGGTYEELSSFRKDAVNKRAAESIRENGNDPSLFSEIVKAGIEILKEFISYLMEHPVESAVGFLENALSEKPKHELSDAEKKHILFNSAKLERMVLQRHSRALYAIEKRIEAKNELLDQIPDNIFHRKERKALSDEIGKFYEDRLIHKSLLESELKRNGYSSLHEEEQHYWKAKREYETAYVKELIAEGKPVPKALQKYEPKVSILQEIAAQKRVIAKRENNKTKVNTKYKENANRSKER